MDQKEKNRIKSKNYRAKNPEKLRQYDKKRWGQRSEKRRKETFKGKYCKICDIKLDGNYGALRGLRVYCERCGSNKKLVRKMYMRAYRKKCLKSRCKIFIR